MTNRELLGKVLVLATNAHAGQFDKGGQPYIMHPLAVMNILQTNDEQLQCIALLHDVLEDTNVTVDDLYAIGCTNRIIDAVLMLTKAENQSYEEYQACVFSNEDAMRVKMADLQHNSDIRRLKGVTDKDLARTAKYQRFYLEIQGRMAQLLSKDI